MRNFEILPLDGEDHSEVSSAEIYYYWL